MSIKQILQIYAQIPFLILDEYELNERLDNAFANEHLYRLHIVHE